MDLDLTGKHALVCGASQGIGLAAARALAELGANVTLLARREERLRELVGTLASDKGQTHGWIAVDSADTDTLRTKVQALVSATPTTICSIIRIFPLRRNSCSYCLKNWIRSRSPGSTTRPGSGRC